MEVWTASGGYSAIAAAYGRLRGTGSALLDLDSGPGPVRIHLFHSSSDHALMLNVNLFAPPADGLFLLWLKGHSKSESDPPHCIYRASGSCRSREQARLNVLLCRRVQALVELDSGNT